MYYHQMPVAQQVPAWRDVWRQITTAAGSENIQLGWAGMSAAEAMRQTSGELTFTAGIGYRLNRADLAKLLSLVEHPPGPDEIQAAVDAAKDW